ncbi:MAG TPA: hypothetical protein GX729_07130 [Firmicutes bacterium]|nr:hypothetical protein [Bacillota bacterium]
MTTAEFKAKFDQFAEEFVAWFNQTHCGEVDGIDDDLQSHKADMATKQYTSTDLGLKTGSTASHLQFFQLGRFVVLTLKIRREDFVAGEIKIVATLRSGLRPQIVAYGSGFGDNLNAYNVYTRIQTNGDVEVGPPKNLAVSNNYNLAFTYVLPA